LKAVFIKRNCLLQTPSADEAATAEVQLRPGVSDGLNSLAAKELFIILLDSRPCGATAEVQEAAPEQVIQRMLDAIRGHGGQVDALLQCPHRPEDSCGCWGTYPGFLYAAAAQLELRLEECYLLCNEPGDILLAYKGGCRPMLILNGRSIGDLYDGHQPEPRDFPIVRDFGSAVQYVLAEEQANEEWGHARVPSSVSQLDEEMAPAGEAREFSGTLRLISPVPGARGALLASLPQVSRSARRLLLLFVFGGVWLSLGIAYILTHLYRVQPFPEFVWYLTLQFIPRPVRGLLFILTGIVVVVVSLRAFMELLPSGGKRK
jgi:histidinol phosphatase-like enzyme